MHTSRIRPNARNAPALPGTKAAHIEPPFQDRRRFYHPTVQLGATWTPEQTTFRIFAPSARAVHVVLAQTPTGDHGTTRVLPMARSPRGIWELRVPGNLENTFYAYRLAGPELDPAREVTDPYAVCTQGRHTRSLIVNLAATDPPGFRTHPVPRPDRPTDAIIYELHIRDVTISADSGVTCKGKYLGLAERGTHLPGREDIRTGLDHLVELGVTHVQWMPVAAFHRATQNETDYRWGYMPVHFFSPEGWYASREDGPSKIREMKQAIQSLHEAGIGVILDVVFNHTAPEADLERIVPHYYYRKSPRGRFCNGSGCGNEFRSESPMARKLILDAVRFWVEEYRVDGFRFDMMALLDIDTMKAVRHQLDRIDPRLLLYGEPWTAGRTPLRRTSDKRRIRGTGIGAFDDAFRNALRGDLDGTEPGFIQAGQHTDAVRVGLAGCDDPWPAQPTEAVHYFACHDNLTAWDKIVKSTPLASVAVREQMLRFGLLILLCAQGVVFLHAGQEFARSKQGHPNTYNLPDAVNRIEWSLKARFAGLCAYVRGLIALRKAHPALRLATREQVRRRLRFDPAPGPQCIACRIDGRDLPGESADDLLILLNGQPRSVHFALPEGNWHILADAHRAGPQPVRQAAGRLTLPAHSGAVLVSAGRPSAHT